MTLKERDTILAEIVGKPELVPAYVAQMEVYGFMHTHTHVQGTVEHTGFLVPCTLPDEALLASVDQRVIASNPWLDNAHMARLAVLDVYSDYMDTSDRLFRAVPVGLFHQLVVRLLVRAKESDFMTSAVTEKSCLVAVNGSYLVLESHLVSRCILIRVSGSIPGNLARQQVEFVAEETRRLLRDYWHLVDDPKRENRLVEVGPVCGCVHDLKRPLLDDERVHMAPVVKTEELWGAQRHLPDSICKVSLSARLCKDTAAAGERPVKTSLFAWWWSDVMSKKPYSRAAALIVGVSEYASSANTHLHACCDLPGVRKSVELMEGMWHKRNFCVQSLTRKDGVTTDAITKASQSLLGKLGEGTGHDALLVVHLIGHGAEDGSGGLLLSDAKPNTDLDALRAALKAQSGFRVCNILVIADF